ncbi:hypothetical protein EAG_00488 [Camponotus floridanus]|uniref:Core-binding (CB) domain-containing protein n=1 Tax=Camponotus floridanus TaxID=104421 RepID=E2A709_CAMFO|nr:hypothetical protein EAG_00488 [Camponotus floridanus]
MTDKNVTIPEDSDELTPPEIAQIAKNTIQSLLPQKSKVKYTTAYNNFIDWTITKNIKSFSENTMLAYFTQLSQMYKPSSVWATYSMLKATLNINNDINIQNYTKLTSFMKQLSKGYQPKKSKVLTPSQIKTFLNEAEDNKHLLTKVTHQT